MTADGGARGAPRGRRAGLTPTATVPAAPGWRPAAPAAPWKRLRPTCERYRAPGAADDAGGATGTGHGADYRIADTTAAVLRAAQAMAMTVLDLLAGAASPVLDGFTLRFTREEYLAFQRRLRGTIEFDGASP